MTLRATLAIVALVALPILGLGYLYRTERDRSTAALAEQATLTARLESLAAASRRAQERSKSDRQVLIAREARKASEARELARQNQTLLNALQAHKAWSDTDVPPEVREALQRPGKALAGDSTGGHAGGGSGADAGGVREYPTEHPSY